VNAGVSDLVHYDPLGRVLRVEHPDGTLDRVETHPWRTTSHDSIDTVLDTTWYAERGSPAPAGPEPADPAVRAAWLAARSARTPAVSHVDPLGRPMLQVVDNGGGDVRGTRVDADLSVLHARVVDTRGREVLRTRADLLGRVLVTDCAERGRSLNLVDVLGQVRFRLDGAGHRVSCAYDDLHRAVRMLTRETPAAADQLTQWVRFGDDLPAAAARNAVGQVVTVFDESGRVDIDGFDYTGAPTGVHRRFVPPTAAPPDWTTVSAAADPDAAAAPLLDPETWSSTSTQDALGRPIQITLPYGTVLQPTFDIANRLATLDVQPGGAGPSTRVLTGQEHDAAGRVLQRRLGNGLHTDFSYDPLTRRLTGLTTGPAAGPVLQGLGFTDDPLGHLTDVSDSAQQTRFFANTVVTPNRRFSYDALYQLVAAEGRELAALGLPDGSDAPVRPLPHVNDTAAVRRYREEYSYDDLGNITDLRHLIGGAGATGWRRRYRYAYETDATDRTNRLAATNLPGDPDGVMSAVLGYDLLGNMTSLPHLATIEWDVLGRLLDADLRGGGVVRYGYGVGGARTRKVVDRGGLVVETLYLGGAEIIRERLGGALQAERRTVLVPGDGGRIAQLDRETVRGGAPVADSPVLRYVHGDSLGSVCLLTNEQGQPVDYEEYHPYGTTAYRSSAPGENLSLKRYRFLDRERDDETGFSHLGERLYAPWLGRWISPDPAGYVDGLNLYRYARNDPANLSDTAGTDTGDTQQYALPADVTTAEQVTDYLHSQGF